MEAETNRVFRIDRILTGENRPARSEMTTPTKHRITTAEELFNMPDDGYRYELVRGELRKMAPSGSEHGDISADIHDS